MFTYPIVSSGSSTPDENATVFPSKNSYGVFDGVDDKVAIPSSSDFNFGTGPFSVSFWINVINSDYHGVILKRGWEIRLTSGTVRFKAPTTEIAVPTSITNTGWCHLVLIRTVEGYRYYYKDGSGSWSAVVDQGDVDSSDPLEINNDAGGTSSLNCYLSDVRIYNDALTADEVTYLYTRGVSGTDPTNTNLVAHYRFDEGEGITVADSAGTNDGTATNITEPAFWHRGVKLDGSDNMSIDIVGTGSGSMNFVNSDPFTVSGWVYRNSSGSGTILGKRNSSTYQYHFRIVSNVLNLLRTGGSVASSVSIPNFTWTHCAVVVASDGTGGFYVNGVSAGTFATKSITSIATDVSIANVGSNGWGLDGRIDNVQVYNDALTADEINYLYTAGAAGTDPTTANLVGHWKLDEGEGSVVADSSGNGNDGTAINIQEPSFWRWPHANFDGSNDYIDTSYERPVSFSYTCWVKADDLSNKAFLGDRATTTTEFFGRIINSTTINTGAGLPNVSFTVPAISAGIWYHITVSIVDATSITLWLNGSLIASTAWAGSITSGGILIIGARRAGTLQPFDGTISNVHIYNDALTTNEALFLATAGRSGTDPTEANLVARWKLRDRYGTNVEDDIGANDGTATNITESTFWVQE